MNLVFAIKSLEVPGGGAERVLVDVANGLVARGHRLSIVTFDRQGRPSFYPLDARISRVALDIGPPGVPTPRWRLPVGLWRMRRAVLDAKPDLVIGFMHSMYVPLAIAMLGSGVRMVASEHVGSLHFANRPLQRLLVRIFDGVFAAKTVPSDVQRREHPARNRGKVHVLPNPLPLREFAATKAVSKRLIILCVGRFMEEKGHDILLDAFAQLTFDFPDWRLRLVGDGVLRPQVEAQIARLGLAGKVELAGVVDGVAREYRDAAIVVVPSRYESFGMTTVEALASGRPVVGFADCLQPLGIVTNGVNAVLVGNNVNRAACLADGLRQAMRSEDLRVRLGAAGPGAVQRFDREAVVLRWEQFLRECVAA